jgi:succinate-semialdehyde dehydrogenase/glutarate-semialdehyde dehydrogenase
MIEGSTVIDRAFLERLARRVTLAGDRREPFTVRTPFTDEPLGTLPTAVADDVVEAIRRAREAQRSWRERPLRKRSRILLRLHDLVWDHEEELLDLIQLENGKARGHAFEEVCDLALQARYYALHGRRYLRERRRRGLYPLLTRAVEQFPPVGVVGFIAPWNFPLILTISDTLAALMAGNAVIVKPDRLAPFTALLGAELLDRAGLPADLCQIVTGRGSELAGALIGGVDFLAFTGSTVTGRLLAGKAGERLINCSMELGGKNAMIILPDADLAKAARVAVWDCFASAGQVCVSIERIYVHESVREEFTERFVEETGRIRMGAALDYRFDLGSLISRAQLDKVLLHVTDAVDRGATLLTGGRPRPDLGPFFFEPTIVTDATEGMLLWAEETFGPVTSIHPFNSIDEAVELANAGPYGLSASLWSRDTRAALRIASRLEVGSVNINDSHRASWGSADLSQGGYKASGLGRRHGAAGIVKYTENRSIAVQRLMAVGPPRGMSEERFHRLLGFLLRLLRRIPGLR